MKSKRCSNFRWSSRAVVVLLAVSVCSTCWSTEKVLSGDVEAKIAIGVAASKAEEAMNARKPVMALKLLLDLVRKYPGNVSALHKYYDFLLNHRIKLNGEERAAALDYARTIWPGLETLEDVFLSVSGEQGIKELFARVADDDEALTRAFTELESALGGDDFKSLAFYAFVATAHADKSIAPVGRLAIPELLLRCGEYKAAQNDFVSNLLDVHFSPELHQRVWFGRAACWEGLGKIKDAVTDYRHAWNCSRDSELGHRAAERIAQIALDQGNRAEALSWSFTIKSANPSRGFSDPRLNELYSGQMACLRGHADKLASSVRERLPAEAGAPGEEELKNLLTVISGVTEDTPQQDGEHRLSKVQVRGLLTITAGVSELFADSSALVARAGDLAQLADSLRFTSRQSKVHFERSLLEASDGMISSALGEALSKGASDGMNGSRLAAAYLYYALTRPDGGRPQLDRLVCSLSPGIEGLDKLYGSRQVSEAIVSACKAARLGARAQAENLVLLKDAVSSAAGAEALRRMAQEAQSTGNHDLAISALKRIEAEFPAGIAPADLTYLLGEAYFMNYEYAEAKAAFARYLAMNPKDEARRIEAEDLSGMCDFYSHDYPAAAANLFRFSQRYPGSERAYMARRVALDSCAGFAESINVPAEEKTRVLLQLTRDFPGSELAWEAHLHLGKLLVDKTADYRGALTHLQAALQGRWPEEAACYIGLCHQNLGDMEQAEEWYVRVIREGKGPCRASAVSLLRALREARQKRSTDQ